MQEISNSPLCKLFLQKVKVKNIISGEHYSAIYECDEYEGRDLNKLFEEWSKNYKEKEE